MKLNLLKAGNDGACNTCPPVPSIIPDYMTAPQKVWNSGIAGFVMIHCSILAGFDPTSQGAWTDNHAAGLLRLRLDGCHIQGSRPAADKATKKRGACSGEVTTFKTVTYTLLDVGNDVNLSVDSLYCFLEQYGNEWALLPITCDYRVRWYDGIRPYSIDADIIETGDNEDDRTWQLEFSYKYPKGVCPVDYYLPWLQTAAPALSAPVPPMAPRATEKEKK